MQLENLYAAASRYDLLKHSFYTRWTAGELTLSELQDYCGEYRHVVAAMPRWLEAMADRDSANAGTLRTHAREEAGHIALWDDFAEAVGCDREELAAGTPNPATADLLATGGRLVKEGRGEEVLWALESQAPAVSVAKLAGLERHYGFSRGAGTRYFEVHSTMDLRHTRELESLMATHGEVPGPAAERTLAGMFGLLSSVEAVVPA